ncbi:MAG TPA: 4Fe-4S binding protein [Firmicutes bacterium]|mgnify:CR=1 FL=1|jgi:pyruvate ferredoxin oxidoreductase delta subunit|nr:4Fe-4S binding protein [Bacillota bacterium]
MDTKWVTPIGDEGIYEINTGKWRTFRPVIDYTKCTSCAICSFFCPVSVVRRHKEDSTKICFDLAYCKGCGICAKECPRQAITMIREEEA